MGPWKPLLLLRRPFRVAAAAVAAQTRATTNVVGTIKRMEPEDEILERRGSLRLWRGSLLLLPCGIWEWNDDVDVDEQQQQQLLKQESNPHKEHIMGCKMLLDNVFHYARRILLFLLSNSLRLSNKLEREREQMGCVCTTSVGAALETLA